MSGPKNNLGAMLAQLGGGNGSSPSVLGKQNSSIFKPTLLSQTALRTTLATSSAETVSCDRRTDDLNRGMVHPASEPGPSRLPMTPIPREMSRTTTPLSRSASSQLDGLPFEKLQARIIKNQAELIELMSKKAALAEGEDVSDEDPEMLDMMIQLHSKRLKELQVALSSRSQSMPSSNPAGIASCAAAALPPTPLIGGGASNTATMLPRSSHAHPSSSAGPSVGRSNGVSIPPDGADPPASCSRSHTSFTRSAPRANPPSSSSFDEQDIAITEELVMPETREIIPPSTPPAPVATPPRPDRNAGAIARQKAIEQARKQEEASTAAAQRSYPSPPAEASSFRPIPGPSQPSGSLPDAAAQIPKVNQIEARSWDKEVEQRLRQVFKLPGFRTHQREAVNETMGGNDVFVLMPTGGGKSLTYQLPAICNGGKTRGVTFVVSPLISLISDQSRHLVKLKIPTIAYTGDLTQSDRNMAHELLSRPEPYTKVVFVTPEMMSMGGQIKNIMRLLLRRNRLARFVIDEAHCVSQWGHDFRDDYLKLGNLRKEFPGVPIMALTATAQNKVQDDIIRTLGIKGCKVLKQSFNRPNLHYEVRPKKRGVIEDMVAFINTQGKISVEDMDRPGRQKEVGVSGIIYCSSRNKCEDIAKTLRDEHNLGAWHYHAGMSKNDRRKTQEGWQEHKFPVIVATVAFGMGIDKPDVRYVIHHSLPRSLEGYYQETGRAGRDGNHSNCILYYSFGDSKIVFQLIEKDDNLTSEQKERQRDSMQEVLRFCNNKTDCRRTQVLAFFSETFDPANCHQGCDICLARDQNRFTIEDVTAPAINVIKLVQAFDRDDRITVKMAVDAFRGVGGGGGKGLDQNPHFGSGKDWDRTEAERLFQTLLIEGGLGEWYGANGAGWSNAYLQVGRKARDFLQSRRQLNMHFRQKSPVKRKAPSKRKSTGATEGDISSFARTTSNPLARQRSRQQIRAEEEAFENSPWGDTDDEYQPDEEDPIEIDDEDDATSTIVDDDEENVPLGIKKRKTSATTKKTAKGSKHPKKTLHLSAIGLRDDDDASVVSVGRENNRSPVEQCLAALRAMMTRVRKSERAAPVIAEETLQMIAATMPTNERALSDIEGLTSGHMKHYAKKILGICVKLLPKDRDPMPPTRSALLPTRPNISAYAYKPSNPSTATNTAVKGIRASSSIAALPTKITTLAAPLARSEVTNKTASGGLFGRPGGVRPVALSLAGQRRPAF